MQNRVCIVGPYRGISRSLRAINGLVRVEIDHLSKTLSEIDTFDAAKPRFLNRGLAALSINPEHTPDFKDRGVEWVDLFRPSLCWSGQTHRLQFLSAATGWEYSEDEAELQCQRIYSVKTIDSPLNEASKFLVI